MLIRGFTRRETKKRSKEEALAKGVAWSTKGGEKKGWKTTGCFTRAREKKMAWRRPKGGATKEGISPREVNGNLGGDFSPIK